MATEETTTATGQAIPAGTWQLDRLHSSVGFEVEHGSVSTFAGGFTDYDAQLGVDGGSLQVTGTARVDSVTIEESDAGAEALKGHVLSPEFFDAERHPEIRFASSDVRLGDGGSLEVDGALTIKETTREVTATGRVRGPAPSIDGSTQKLAVELETVIDRTDFGLNWQMELPDGGAVLGNDVRLIVRLELAHSG